MKDPVISVIVPAYNVEGYIEECLDSLLSQTWTSFEVIVIDDGSKDHTADVVQKLAEKDRRIRLLQQDNAGVSRARNQGLCAANGTFISFVDGDDIVHPDFLARLHEAIQGAEMAIIGVENIHDNREHSPRRQLKDNTISNFKDARHLLSVFSTGAWDFPNWNKLFRRSIILEQDIRFKEGLSIGEDRLFNLQYLIHCTTVRTIDTMGYGYRLRPNSAYRSASPLMLWQNHCQAMQATQNVLSPLTKDLQKALRLLFITSPTIHTALPELLDGLQASKSDRNQNTPNLNHCLALAQRSWFDPAELSLSITARWMLRRYSRGNDWPAVAIWNSRIS